MGKKIVLSESQFKNYMRKLLKEDRAGEVINNTYIYLAGRLRQFADEVESYGKAYTNLYDIIFSELSNLGIKVINSSEGKSGYFDSPSLFIQADFSNVQIPGDSDDESVEEYLSSELEYLSCNIKNYPMVKQYFEYIEISIEDGKIVVLPEPKYENFKVNEIKKFLD